MTSLSETSLLAGSSGVVSGYEIDQSIRFNDNDSAYLSKTWSGAGDKQKFTFSSWVKRANITSRQCLLSFRQDVPLEFEADDTLRVFLFGTTALNTNRVFRDPSAFYHIVLSVDSTQAVPNDRVILYVNGERETSFSAASYPSLNATANIYTSSLENYIGRIVNSTYYFDGYMAEIHFTDGYSYGPEYFGEFKEDTDIWIPKEVSDVTYGTNGYYIDGRDSSDLGDDESGQGNDFTSNNFATNDQRADSPTNNHVTFNPVAVYIDGATHTFANGNLDVSNASGSWGSAQTGLGIPGSGKWTFAFKLTNSITGTAYPIFGIIDSENQQFTDGISLPYQSGTPANSMVYVNTFQDASQAYFFKGGAGSESTIGSAFSHGGATSGEWQWFVNSDDKELTVYHNGTKRLDAYDISFLTFPVFIAATLYDYDDLRLLNLPGTEYTPSISGYKTINTKNIGL